MQGLGIKCILCVFFFRINVDIFFGININFPTLIWAQLVDVTRGVRSVNAVSSYRIHDIRRF